MRREKEERGRKAQRATAARPKKERLASEVLSPQDRGERERERNREQKRENIEDMGEREGDRIEEREREYKIEEKERE